MFESMSNQLDTAKHKIGQIYPRVFRIALTKFNSLSYRYRESHLISLLLQSLSSIQLVSFPSRTISFNKP